MKDRYGAQIRTHYPRTAEHELAIVAQERSSFKDAEEVVVVPPYIQDILAEFTSLARGSPDVNQRSGVSVRVSIANYETLVACALRRAVRYRETQAAPRISDLPYILASTSGKLELETVEEGRESRVVEELTKKAVLNTFSHYFTVGDFAPLIQGFEEGLTIEVGSDVPSFVYVEKLGIRPKKQEALFASGVESVLEGLHLNRRLNRDRVEGKYRYRG